MNAPTVTMTVNQLARLLRQEREAAIRAADEQRRARGESAFDTAFKAGVRHCERGHDQVVEAAISETRPDATELTYGQGVGDELASRRRKAGRSAS